MQLQGEVGVQSQGAVGVQSQGEVGVQSPFSTIPLQVRPSSVFQRAPVPLAAGAPRKYAGDI